MSFYLCKKPLVTVENPEVVQEMEVKELIDLNFQLLFSLLVLFVYKWLDGNGFIEAQWLLRPVAFFSVLIGTCGALLSVSYCRLYSLG